MSAPRVVECAFLWQLGLDRGFIADHLRVSRRAVSGYLGRFREERQPEVDALEAQRWQEEMGRCHRG